MANSMEGQETVHSVVGPIAHSVPDMRLFVNSVLEQQPWSYDSKVIPLPWRQSEEDAIKTKISSSQLTLGFFECDGNVRTRIPNSRPFLGLLLNHVRRSCLTLPSSEASRQSSTPSSKQATLSSPSNRTSTPSP